MSFCGAHLHHQIFLCLREWSNGVHTKADYDLDPAEREYNEVMTFMRKMKGNVPNKYHRLMHKVYVNVL